MAQSKHWTFTTNNYVEDDCWTSLPRGVSYVIFGKEVASTGTHHLQGFLSFSKRVRASQVKALLPRSHIEVARHVQQAIEYCKKEGSFTELGVSPAGQGKRSDLELFKAYVREGNYDLSDIREKHSSIVARYPGFVYEYLEQHYPRPAVELFPLRSWQQCVWSTIEHEVHPRRVYFIVDEAGNAGKTWFTRYCKQHRSDVWSVRSGKKADMAMSFPRFPSPRVVFIDVPRSKSETLQYDFIEEIKDGHLFSGKYHSTNIHFEPPHVFVMMNEHPDMTKLSRDRYEIIHANAE